jgi:hypothetical protein
MRFGSVDPSEGFSCPPNIYLHRYPHKTQLAEAVAFLHAQPNHVSLVTIDIVRYSGDAVETTVEQRWEVRRGRPMIVEARVVRTRFGGAS